jgi:tetratricopeptide (TPR) repeat protein
MSVASALKRKNRSLCKRVQSIPALHVGGRRPIKASRTPVITKPTRPVIASTLAIAVTLVLVYLAFRQSNATREELARVPGAAVAREGVSSQTELFDEALRLLGRRNFVGAESVYREVLQHEPRSAPAYLGLGTTRFHQNDLAGAEKHYQRALDLDPASAGAALGLGSVAYSQRRYSSAVQYYRRALETKTADADAHWGLGLAYDALGRRADARTHYAEFLRLAPSSGQAGVARSRLAELKPAGTRTAARTTR